MDRRSFLGSGAAFFPALLRSQQSRPRVVGGVQAGDPLPREAILWARADRPARMFVEYSAREDFRDARVARGPFVTVETDFTGRVRVRGLPPGQPCFYRVRFEGDGRAASTPVVGRLWTAPAGRSDVRFVWGADTVGQGWGIAPEHGGLLTYESMRALEPHFFVHVGDTIYADGPVPAEVPLPDGGVWRNVVTEEKSKVAETLDEFRGNFRYNLLDDHLRRFNAEIAQVWQWDDHEVRNNWSPGGDLTADDRYRVKDMRVLVERARRAFLEYAPGFGDGGGARIYRRIAYGPLLDLFVIDLRSYRGANTFNRQPGASGETAFLGSEQLRWLERELARSRAVWKVVASDMPLGLVVPDGEDAEGRARFEGLANGDGPPLGRELELERLLASLKQARVRNVVWITGDVHYAAAHHYDPGRSRFADFDPFWEFVAGPLHAGSFGPNELDATFGPEIVFQQHAQGENPDRSPRAGLQFFGEVRIDAGTEQMTVYLRDRLGRAVFTRTLDPRTQD